MLFDVHLVFYCMEGDRHVCFLLGLVIPTELGDSRPQIQSTILGVAVIKQTILPISCDAQVVS